MKMHCSKLHLGAIGGTLLLLILVFGGKGAYHHLRALFSEAAEFTVKAASDEHLLRVAAGQLDDARGRIQESEGAAAGLRRNREKIETEIAALQSQANRAKARLAELKPALDQGGDFARNGRRYSPAEVRQEAGTLVAHLQALSKEIDLHRNQSAEIGHILESNAQDARQARQEIAAAETRIRELDLKIRNARALREAGELSGALRGELAGASDGLSRTLGELEERINRLQGSGRAKKPAGGLPEGIIDWEDGSDAESGGDLGKQIEELLGSQPAIRPSVPAIDAPELETPPAPVRKTAAPSATVREFFPEEVVQAQPRTRVIVVPAAGPASLTGGYANGFGRSRCH